MRIKYLVPMATLASTAAIVTPLVTSCGNGDWDAQWDFKANGAWKSVVANATSDKPLEETKATQKYFDDLNNNHAIFWNDFFLFANLTYEGVIEMSGQINELCTKIKIDNVDPVNHLLSFKIYGMSDVTMQLPTTDEPIRWVAGYDLVFENIEWTISRVDSESSDDFWRICTAAIECPSLAELISVLDKQETWSVKGRVCSANNDEPIVWTNIDFNQNNKPDTSEKGDLIREALGIESHSEYLSDIEYDPTI